LWIRSSLGCALTFATEAKFEIEAKISFRLEAKKAKKSKKSKKAKKAKKVKKSKKTKK
jgi:hypothetical protein